MKRLLILSSLILAACGNPPTPTPTSVALNCGTVIELGANSSGDMVARVDIEGSARDGFIVVSGPVDFIRGDRIAFEEAGDHLLYRGKCE